jgi:hypothetical protein
MLDQLRDLYEARERAASTMSLQRLIDRAGALPPLVEALYRDFDGCAQARMKHCMAQGMRPMPIDEVLQMSPILNEYSEDAGCWLDSIVWLWTDDNSNYFGLYTQGPCAGFAVRLMHDDWDLSPTHRDAEELFGAIVTALERDRYADVHDVPRSLPRAARTPAHDADELALALRYQALLESTDNEIERSAAAGCFLALLPFGETERAVALFDDPDMYVQERAAALLGQRSWRAGVPALERLARRGQGNGASQAMRVLADMGTHQSEAALERLADELEGPGRRMLSQILRFRDDY